jgi:uncharacterized protein HemX
VSEAQDNDAPLPNGKAHHTSPRAEEIEEGSRAVRRLAAPGTFPQVLALLALAIACGAGYLLVQSGAQDRAAFVAALDRNTAALTKVTEAVTAHELAATIRAQASHDRGR